MKKEIIKGYKVFNPDFTCRGFKFEEGKEFKHDGKLVICQSGFHFCLKAVDCFSYYNFDPNNIVAEVEAIGKVEYESNDSKAVTNHIKILRILKWSEVLDIVNTGSGNSGNRNSGNRNSGNGNSGDWNSGNGNSGDRNSGNWNSGDWNSGNGNSGDRNSGNWNSGDRNSGYGNSGNGNSGVFCTGEEYIKIFNKKSKWTMEDFENSSAFFALSKINTHIWVPSSLMNDTEKTENESHETYGGYLKKIPFKEAFKSAWDNWDDETRSAFTSLPNFNAEIFNEITGVKI